VQLEIRDRAGRRVRLFRSDDEPEPMLEGQQVPPRWVRPPQVLSAGRGMHRFVWDLRYETPAGMRRGYPISAIDGYTPAEPRGPIALPGDYVVRLTVDGRVEEQVLHVDMDPRVETSDAALEQQFDLSMRIKDVLDRRDEVGVQADTPRLRGLFAELEGLYRILQGSDQAPGLGTVALVNQRVAAAERLLPPR
jgi:hypothetical protein